MLCLKNGIVGWCINPCTLFLPDSLKHGLRIFSPAGDMASFVWQVLEREWIICILIVFIDKLTVINFPCPSSKKKAWLCIFHIVLQDFKELKTELKRISLIGFSLFPSQNTSEQRVASKHKLVVRSSWSILRSPAYWMFSASAFHSNSVARPSSLLGSPSPFPTWALSQPKRQGNY